LNLNTSYIIFTIIGLAFLAAVGAWGLRRLAVRDQVLMDIPNERSSHSRPKPRGGGIVIALITLLGVGLAWAFNLAQMRNVPPQAIMTYLVCGSVIAVVGWVDDMHSLSSGLRLAIQFACALASIVGIGYVQAIYLVGIAIVPLGILGALISVVWVVGLTNAYNFMDGIDGIAGGQAVVCGAFWAYLGTSTSNGIVFVIALLIVSSSLGFLWHNWSPSRIIMGDVGSTFLGYSFAVLPLLFDLTISSGVSVGWTTGVLVMWAFLLDTAVTMLKRAIRRENIFQAHRSHYYQRLIIAGHSHAKVSLLYIVLAIIGGWVALVLYY
jgi:UDP-N-acetylmuramyl pentapeptide phosphotransferase/UDP-N-acetylglucosamine-1-phosphate transferase